MTAVEARRSSGVLVLGMHRSGTSVATRAISLLGVPLGAANDLWLGLPGNPTGYWESSSLTRFDEGLLHTLGSAWWCPPRLGEIEALGADHEATQRAAALFRALHVSDTWVWKDPRTCITLPFWRRALDARLSCVLMLRNPLEVAASLNRRDGIESTWALALWERYLRLALGALEGLPVLVTDYAELIESPLDWLESAAGFLGERGFEVGEGPGEAEGFLHSDLRHTTFGDDDLLAAEDASPQQRELQFVLRGLAGAWDSFSVPRLPAETPTTDELFQELRASLPLDHLPESRVVQGFLPRRRSSPESEDPMNTVQTAASSVNGNLSTEWREWVATNLLARVSREQIVATMVGVGVLQAVAESEIDAVLADPCWRAGNRFAQRLGKLESMLDVHEQLDALDDRAFRLDRMRGLSRRDFLERYYARNRPVVMLGLTDGWLANTAWTPERLKERLGHVEVEVQSDRDSDRLYEVHSNEHKQQMPLGDYIDRISAGGPGNDLYLTANNHFFEQAETTELLGDFEVPREYLGPTAPPGSVFFWFGPAGTVTPLHHDVVNVLFVQVHGRKRISLIPSLQTHRVYNTVGVYSEIDPKAPDLERYPRYAAATRTEIVVGPGEALFIPVGWWHHVESLDTSVSLSFTNFVFDNNYVWEHPSIDA